MYTAQPCTVQVQCLLYTTSHIDILAWEPSLAQVTYSYSRRLPALGRFYFLLLKSIHLI